MSQSTISDFTAAEVLLATRPVTAETCHHLPVYELMVWMLTQVVKQGELSVGREGGCAYRSPEGHACAVGHCIPNERYKETFEGMGIETACFSDSTLAIVGGGNTDKAADLRVGLNSLRFSIQQLKLMVFSQRLHDHACGFTHFKNCVEHLRGVPSAVFLDNLLNTEDYDKQIRRLANEN